MTVLMWGRAAKQLLARRQTSTTMQLAVNTNPTLLFNSKHGMGLQIEERQTVVVDLSACLPFTPQSQGSIRLHSGTSPQAPAARRRVKPRLSLQQKQLNGEISKCESVVEILDSFERAKRDRRFRLNISNLTTAVHRIATLHKDGARTPVEVALSDVLFKGLEKHVSSKQTDVSPRDISEILWALAKLRMSSSKLVAQLERLLFSIGFADFSPAMLSKAAWAFVALGARPLKLFDRMEQDLAATDLSRFPTHALSGIVWAFAKVGHPARDLFPAIEAALLSVTPKPASTASSSSSSSSSFSSALLLTGAGAGEQAAVVSPAAAAAAVAAGAARRTTVTATTETAATTTATVPTTATRGGGGGGGSIASASASASHRDDKNAGIATDKRDAANMTEQHPSPTTLDQTPPTTSTKPPRPRAAAKTVASDAMPSLSLVPPPTDAHPLPMLRAEDSAPDEAFEEEDGSLLDLGSESRIGSRFERLSPRTISNLLWAFASVEHNDPSRTPLLFAELQRECFRQGLSAFSNPSLTSVLWAFATTDRCDEQLASAVESELVARGPETMRPADICSVAWSFCKANHPAEAFFNALQTHIAAVGLQERAGWDASWLAMLASIVCRAEAGEAAELVVEKIAEETLERERERERIQEKASSGHAKTASVLAAAGDGRSTLSCAVLTSSSWAFATDKLHVDVLDRVLAVVEAKHSADLLPNELATALYALASQVPRGHSRAMRVLQLLRRQVSDLGFGAWQPSSMATLAWACVVLECDDAAFLRAFERHVLAQDLTSFRIRDITTIAWSHVASRHHLPSSSSSSSSSSASSSSFPPASSASASSSSSSASAAASSSSFLAPLMEAAAQRIEQDGGCAVESLTQLAQVILATTDKDERDSAMVCSVVGALGQYRKQNPPPKSSGLHQRVSAALSNLKVPHVHEVAVLEGAFFIDLVVLRRNRPFLAIEVDGPSHFHPADHDSAQWVETTGTRFKRHLLEKEGEQKQGSLPPGQAAKRQVPAACRLGSRKATRCQCVFLMPS